VVGGRAEEWGEVKKRERGRKCGRERGEEEVRREERSIQRGDRPRSSWEVV